MSLRTLVGSYDQEVGASGTITQAEHVIFAYEAMTQNTAWKIKEIQVWLNSTIESGGDGRTVLNYCLSTDFLTPPVSGSGGALRQYAEQFNARDNRGIAWGQGDYQNRDATNLDFRVVAMGNIAHGVVADDRRAINYLSLNSIIQSDNSAISTGNTVNYRIIMEAEKVTAVESIVHQIRGMAQDVDN